MSVSKVIKSKRDKQEADRISKITKEIFKPRSELEMKVIVARTKAKKSQKKDLKDDKSSD